jgi:predicted choloylglycine hydrolase
MPYIQRDSFIPDYRIFDLIGDHYACGFQMGRQTALRTIPTPGSRPIDLAFAQACADRVGYYHPALLDEYRGYADGQSRPWEDVLPHFSLNHPAGKIGGCSTLVWCAADGRVLVARNYDFTSDQQSRYLIKTSPPCFHAVLGTNASLIGGRYDGVNEAGLFVALHLVRWKEPASVGPAIPFHLAPRILLETCQTADQALTRLLDMPLMHAFNYVLADEREFFVVEVYPQARRVRQGKDRLIVTNHFQHPDMEAYHGPRKATNSRQRQRRLEELWGMRRGDPWTWGQEILTDHVGPLCNHDRHLATLWSLVADLTRRRIAYSLGTPCEEPYVELRWPGHAAQPHLVCSVP